MYPAGASHICACKGEHISQGMTDRGQLVYTAWEMAGYEDLTTMQMPSSIPDRIQVARAITKQIVEALALLSMFNPPIIHHDMKGENVMVTGNLDEGFHVKIIDFGCFIPATEDMKSSESIGDYIYMPPEHSPSCAFADPPSSLDMYAVGRIHMELICPELLQHGDWYPIDGPTPAVEFIIQAMQRTCPGLFAADVLDLIALDLSLIQSCLHADPHERPTPLAVVEKLSMLGGKSSLVHEKVAFTEGDMVEMLINMEWVQSVVKKASEDTYDLEACDEHGCSAYTHVDPALVKAAGEIPSIQVPDVSPRSSWFEFQIQMYK